MEKLQAMLGDTLDQFAMLKNALDEASGSAADRQKRNARLHERPEKTIITSWQLSRNSMKITVENLGISTYIYI